MHAKSWEDKGEKKYGKTLEVRSKKPTTAGFHWTVLCGIFLCFVCCVHAYCIHV